MKHILCSLAFAALAACGGGDDGICKDDHCVCTSNESCTYDCEPGGLDCNIQCQPGSDCDIGCNASENCHIECTTSSSCTVDCANGPDCNITCPSTGCTVMNCPAGSCDVTCGLGALPTRNGSTATCP